MMEIALLKQIIECALLAAGEPVSLTRLQQLLEPEECPPHEEWLLALAELTDEFAQRGLRLKEVASGYCLQIQPNMQQWIHKLWEKRPPRYSRALLETLALVAYRQPITRAEIEDVRGVAVSSEVVKKLMEREWIRIVGHRDVPGKPALYATTRQFLDYFNLKSLVELPPMAELATLLKSVNETIPALPANEVEAENNEKTASITQEINGNEQPTVAEDNETSLLLAALPVEEEALS